MDFTEIKNHLEKTNAQAHLCICNTDLFDGTVSNGIYGFPHSGNTRLKSFWRALAGLYNIGSNDLIFLYRTSGWVAGCQEIHGPFKIHTFEEEPAIYYDKGSKNFPMSVKGDSDCSARFLFTSFGKKVFSINDNFELIKKFESREIWGYRHPAVMNIGAARKKSITSFTNFQAKVLMELFEKYGVERTSIKSKIPAEDRIKYYKKLKTDYGHFHLDDSFLRNNYSNDEAYLYCYLLRALKFNKSGYRKDLIKDMGLINDAMLKKLCKTSFQKMTSNILLETIITNHLQDELDIVLTNNNDNAVLICEIKTVQIDQAAVTQTEKYLDLMEAIFKGKTVVANIIGDGKETSLHIDKRFKERIKLIGYNVEQEPKFKIRFKELT